MNKVRYGVLVLTIAFPSMNVSSGSQDTIGPNGINSAGLRGVNGVVLTGEGVDIGQVEPFRPGFPGVDDPLTKPDCCNEDVVPTGVFFRDMVADVNQGIVDHAIAVAGVMISTATTATEGHSPPTGVAIEANLYSGAHFAQTTDQPNAALTAENIASIANVPR